MNPTGMMAAAARAYMAQKNAQNPNPSPEGQAQVSSPDQEDPTTYGRLKKDWNDFQAWMKTQQIDGKPAAGNPALDTRRKGAKETLGQEMFHRYIKENPQTTLSDKMMPLIRMGLMDIRDKEIGSMKMGKSYFDTYDQIKARGQNPEEYFMRPLLLNEQSANPDFVGQALSQYTFPYEKDAQGNVVIPTEKFGGDFEIAEWLKAEDPRKYVSEKTSAYFDNYYSKKPAIPQLAKSAPERYGSWIPSYQLSERMKTIQNTQQ